MPTTEIKQTRFLGLHSWGVSKLRSLGHAVDDDFQLLSVSDDASFRRYFRGITDDTSYILVDAPPDKEDNESFVTVYERLSSAGVLVRESLRQICSWDICCYLTLAIDYYCLNSKSPLPWTARTSI